MDEATARGKVREIRDVPRETMHKLDALVELLQRENEQQNLIARSTVESIWSRHILDSAQLLRFDLEPAAHWLDLGSGAGFPGLVVAALRSGPVTLIEQRKLRVDFLGRAAAAMQIDCEILHGRVERVPPRPFRTISARAFAPLPDLFDLGARFANLSTRWILPKGRNAQSELEAARASWQGDFRLEPSLTDTDARIIVAEQVRRRREGKQRA